MAQPDKIAANLIRLEAACGNAQYETVYEGMVLQCMPDYNQTPNVGVRIEASTTAWYMHGVPATNSGKAGQAIAAVIEGLDRQIGFGFKNNSVTAIFPDYNVSGSAINQMR